MALTRDFRETIRERAQAEQAFRKALLGEAIEILISGDEKTGRAILRNYVNATAFRISSRRQACPPPAGQSIVEKLVGRSGASAKAGRRHV